MSSPNIFLSLRLTIGGRTTNIIGQQRSADMNNQPAYIALIAVIEAVASNGEFFQTKLISYGRLDDDICEYSTDADRVWGEIRAVVKRNQERELVEDACTEWVEERRTEENHVLALDASEIMAAHAAGNAALIDAAHAHRFNISDYGQYLQDAAQNAVRASIRAALAKRGVSLVLS